MKWTNDDVLLVEKLIEIKNRGYYCDGTQLTQVYNRVLEKNANVTNCGSCMRARIQELENALNNFKKTIEVNSKASESVSDVEPTTIKEEENNEPTEANKRSKGRPKKDI